MVYYYFFFKSTTVNITNFSAGVRDEASREKCSFHLNASLMFPYFSVIF